MGEWAKSESSEKSDLFATFLENVFKPVFTPILNPKNNIF